MQIRIHTPSQTLDLLDDAGETIRCYAISTSRFGLGAEPGSFKTPSGHFRVSEKIGDGASPGEIFVGRVPTGKFDAEKAELFARSRDVVCGLEIAACQKYVVSLFVRTRW